MAKYPTRKDGPVKPPPIPPKPGSRRNTINKLTKQIGGAGKKAGKVAKVHPPKSRLGTGRQRKK